jgi:pantetheine-phosphate adenylyltransferase
MRRVAIYPGSFDPPTLGHLDVIERASLIFDEITVSVGVNSSKRALLTTEQRLEALTLSTSHLVNVRVSSFTGLLVEYAKRAGAAFIVRGLRATADFEYEFQMALVNRRLDSTIETVFLMTKWEYSYLSSSIVREVAVLGGDFESLVPGPVAAIIKGALPCAKTGEAIGVKTLSDLSQ